MDSQHEKMCEHGAKFIANAISIRENKLYRADYDTFDEFMEQRFDKTRQWLTQQSNRLTLVNGFTNPSDIGLKAAQPLISLPAEEREEAYTEAKAVAESEGKSEPTTKQVKEVVQARKNAAGGVYEKPETNIKPGPDGEAMLAAARRWQNNYLLPWINYYDQADACEDAMVQFDQVLKFMSTHVESVED